MPWVVQKQLRSIANLILFQRTNKHNHLILLIQELGKKAKYVYLHTTFSWSDKSIYPVSTGPPEFFAF